jgi:hypothetical protein
MQVCHAAGTLGVWDQATVYETKLQSVRPRATANTVVLGVLIQIQEQQNNNLCLDSIPIIDILTIWS